MLVSAVAERNTKTAMGDEEIQEEALEALPEPMADPAMDVEALLEQALTEEVIEAPNPLLATSLEEGSPSFQLQWEMPEDPAKILAELEKHSLTLKNSHGKISVLSQLTEFQALSLRKALLALGVPVTVQLHMPLPTLSEEEQALGDHLSAVPEFQAAEVEGAPSVTLPANEKEVMLLLEPAAGVLLQQSLGLVTAHRAIARHFFREEEAQEKLRQEMQRIAPQKSLPGSRLEALLRELLRDLQKMVLNRGGNALLGIRLEAFPESSHLDPALEQLRLVAFGTAAVVEKSSTI